MTPPSNDDASSLHGQLTSHDELKAIVDTFPQKSLMDAFGYGSGVFSQNIAEESKSGGILDMIFIVSDAQQFHQENLQLHPHHYASWLRYLGPSTATNLQRSFPLQDAKVLFHVVDDPVPMKYGVVEWSDLEQDLREWRCLYLAGRLHKPTMPILSPTDQFVDAQQANLQAAVAAALLLLQSNRVSHTRQSTVAENSDVNDAATAAASIDGMIDDANVNDTISWPSLYGKVASLSYTGDFRMQVGGEDPLKLTKLVHSPGQLDRFHSLYKDSAVLQKLQQQGLLQLNDNGIEWDSRNGKAHRCLWECLPGSIQQPSLKDANDLVRTSQERGIALAKALGGIVAPVARNQSLKGLFTLGFRKSVRYASAKLSKGLFRNR